MSILDLQAFLRERLSFYDPNIDTSPGSEADKRVIQPILRRLGSDPFSMDLPAYILDRLNQEFPGYTTKDGDALTDMLVKPMQLLLDPIVRENRRVRGAQSFRDPSTLTIDEAEGLGANFFVDRSKGEYARGVARIYFAQPQSVDITPANYCGSRSGLNFPPDSSQSITVEEMLFNIEGDEYFFDLNVIAEQPGDEYNIEADELFAIAGLSSAVRVTNKRRFTKGIKPQNALEYIDYIQRNITERSLVTKKGIIANTMNSFPEMTRINVVGFNDPEMQRDIIEGGGLGVILQAGLYGFAVADGENKTVTRRIKMDPSMEGPVDFTALIGPPGTVGGSYRLTLHGLFVGSARAKDIAIRKVVSATELDLEEQIIPATTENIVWVLRKRSLTISKIPGGILFPDGPNGTVDIPDETVHIGGCTDVHVRGTVFDTASLVLDALTDDEPILRGVSASTSSGEIVLGDYIMFGPGAIGANYATGDDVWQALEDAQPKMYALQIIDGPAAGVYRIESVTHYPAGSPHLSVLPAPTSCSGNRWRIIDVIDVDLTDPKETRVSGADLQTTQATNVVTTAAGTDFHAFGVAVGDILRISSGPDADDYTIKEVPPFPAYTTLVIDKETKFTHSSISYSIFRANKAGAVNRPLIRVTSVDLLDTSSQPVGSVVPYAKPVGAWSTAFANPAHGVKDQVTECLLGIIGIQLSPGMGGGPVVAPVGGKILQLRLGVTLYTITFTGGGGSNVTLAGIISQINAAVGQVVAVDVDDRLGINTPDASTPLYVVGGTSPSTSALPALFGDMYYLCSSWIRCPAFSSDAAYFEGIRPTLDFTFDVVDVLDGNEIGVHKLVDAYPFPGHTPVGMPGGLTAPNHLEVDFNFAPNYDIQVKYGARSYGQVRLYFLDPTTIEFNASTYFLATLDNGTVVKYIPDFTLEAQLIPALPSGTKPKDGSSTASSHLFTSLGTDFIAKGIRVGDTLYIDFVPVTGSIALSDPVSDLAFTTLIISLDGNPDKTITFVKDSTSLPGPNDVTRKGVADQINAAVGKTICKITTTNYLEFEPEVSLVIRHTGSANTLLGFSTMLDTDNAADHDNPEGYAITVVTQHQLTLEQAIPSTGGTEQREQFRVSRPATQRVGTTQMSVNAGPAGFCFADVELISEGTGDLYNITADTPMEAYGYRSDGYYLTTPDENLTFSSAEPLVMHVSRTMNEVGTDDDPENATVLVGQNLQVNYDRSSLVSTMQDYLQSELERVVCASPLSRNLVPHFIRFDLVYSGGPKESEVTPDIETLIHALFPDQQLEISDIEGILTERGATSISNPLTLFGVVYNVDRTVTLEKSNDRINVGRLAAFIPDRLNLTKSVL